MTITTVSTRSCERIYDVDGTRLRLFIITGGTPALSFEDHYFTQRYPDVERWDNHKYWNNGKYDHQKKPIQGPAATEVLPNGFDDLRTFVEVNLPKHTLRMKRVAALPFKHRKTSGRFHNTEYHYYFTLNVRILGHYISCVTMDSAHCSGQVGDDTKYITDAWRHLHAVLAKCPTKPTKPDGSGWPSWEDLTEDQFDKVKQAMEAVA